MKKQILIIATIVVGLGLTACSSETSGLEKEVSEKTEKTEKEVEVAVPGATYQCPDDCENGPSYDKPGPCAKCGKDMEIL